MGMMQLWHHQLYGVCEFHWCRMSTSYLSDFVHTCVRPKIISVTYFSATTYRNELKFGMHLWHYELYRVCEFHWCRMSTSCLLDFVHTCVRPEIISVTHFSATAYGNDLKFCMRFWHHELYRVCEFHWCRMSTSCIRTEPLAEASVSYGHILFKVCFYIICFIQTKQT